MKGDPLLWKDFARVPMVAATDERLGHPAFRLLCIMHGHCLDQDTNCIWPSQARLAELMNTPQPNISRYLKELAARGYIRAKRIRDAKTATYIRTEYTLKMASHISERYVANVAPGSPEPDSHISPVHVGHISPVHKATYQPDIRKTKKYEDEEVKREDTTPPGGDDGAVPAPVAVPSDAFVIFWAAWPQHFRKEDKGKTASYWRTHRLDLVADAIMAGLSGWKASEQWGKEGGQFIPAPLPWLRKEAWERPGPPPVIGANGHKMAAEKTSDAFGAYYERITNGPKNDGPGPVIRASVTGGGVPPGDG